MFDEMKASRVDIPTMVKIIRIMTKHFLFKILIFFSHRKLYKGKKREKEEKKDKEEESSNSFLHNKEMQLKLII